MIVASGFVAHMLLGPGLLCYLEFPIKSHVDKKMLDFSTPKHIVFPKELIHFCFLH